MKKLGFVLIIIMYQFSFSQTKIKRSSIDNGGGRFDSGAISVISTVGEVAIQEYMVNALKVSEGFINKGINALEPQNSNCIAPPNNLISWWAAEDNANDSVGANHGTPLGGISYVSGVVNKAFLFNGVDDVVVVPHSEDLDITGDMTLELWVRRIGYANRSQTVICKGAGYVPLDEPAVFAMRFENDLTEFLFEDTNGNNSIVNGPAYEDSQWHHYAYVRQGNQHVVYADGFDFGWTSFANVPESSSGLPLTIGAQYHNPTNAQYDYSNFFHGEVDEVSVYNRALSQEEILSIFNGRNEGKCAVTLNIENNVASKNKIKVYPNPVSDTFTIAFENSLGYNFENLKLEIFDLLGNRVKVLRSIKFSKTQVNMNIFKQGVYFYRIKDNNKVIGSGKLLKK